MSHDQKPLSGRVAIVTGSGRNIGKAIAIALATDGATVIVNGHRDRNALEQTLDEIRSLGAEGSIALADVGSPDQVDAMVEETVRRFGRIDIAVSNVAVRHHQPFLSISVDDWQRTLETNLSSAFYMARSVLPHMKRENWGRIVHISGRDGFRPKPNRAHNVTCKAGTFALSKAIAIEFGEFGITANAVAPGVIDVVRDPAHYPSYVEEYEQRRRVMPVRRLGRPEDIAGAVRFLCGADSGYITGQLIHVNGGEHLF